MSQNKIILIHVAIMALSLAVWGVGCWLAIEVVGMVVR